MTKNEVTTGASQGGYDRILPKNVKKKKKKKALSILIAHSLPIPIAPIRRF